MDDFVRKCERKIVCEIPACRERANLSMGHSKFKHTALHVCEKHAQEALVGLAAFYWPKDESQTKVVIIDSADKREVLVETAENLGIEVVDDMSKKDIVQAIYAFYTGEPQVEEESEGEGE